MSSHQGLWFERHRSKFRLVQCLLLILDYWPEGGPLKSVIRIHGRDDLHKIVVLNPKGGSGKTTLATNIASALAARGSTPTLIDCDPQGYCTQWIEKRPSELPEIYGIQCIDDANGTSAAIDIDVPPDSDVAIVDTPAAIPHDRLYDYTFFADSLLIPIQASTIDVHAATRFIAELLLDAQLERRDTRLAIVASRVRARTRSYERLLRFLTSLRIPMIAALRDSQNFISAADAGIGICELPAYRAKQDLPQLARLIDWLDQRRATTEQGAPEDRRLSQDSLPVAGRLQQPVRGG